MRYRISEAFSLIEVMIAIAVFSMVLVGVGAAFISILSNNWELKENSAIALRCSQVLQEITQNSETTLAGMTTVPTYPSESSSIANFTVSGVTGTGNVKLSKVLTSGSYEVLKIRVFFPNTGTPVCQLETYLSK